jgi:multiple sugar transport system substrate-binding protein
MANIIWNRQLTRRDLLYLAAASGISVAAAACGAPGVSSGPSAAQSNKSLKILQWSHFVPAYDKWIDGFVKSWGQSTGIAASIDHINTYDLPARIAAEVAAGGGHDLTEMNAQILTYLYQDHLVEMDDVVEYAISKLGQPEPIAQKVAYINGHWYGWPDFYIAILPIIRMDLFSKYGFNPDQVKTWDDYMNVGAAGKKDNHAAGLAISHCNDSNHNWRACMYAYGGHLVDADGKTPTVDIAENSTFLSVAQEFYAKANTPEVFAWDDASDNRWLDSGQGVYIHDALSSMRSVQSTNPGLYNNLAMRAPIAGPAKPNGVSTPDPNCYVIWKWSKNVNAAKDFLKHYIDNYMEAFTNSQIYNMPTHAGPWQHPLFTDPQYGGKYADPRFAVLNNYRGDVLEIFGSPGPPNYAADQVLANYVLPDMVATAVKQPGSGGVNAAIQFGKQKLALYYGH